VRQQRRISWGSPSKQTGFSFNLHSSGHPPANHSYTQLVLWLYLPDEYSRGKLKADVSDVEESNTIAVLLGSHLELFCHASHCSVTDVTTVLRNAGTVS